MSEAITPVDVWKELRKPFPKEVIGKIPKGGVMLDYVGHAAVTDRLLQVDPTWTWEPFAVREDGLPATDKVGNLWIRLTINGVTRIGVGDGATAKECIGDAIRNAAMRFGVALDLWTKEELESTLDKPEAKNPRPTADEKPAAKPSQDDAGLPPTDEQQERIIELGEMLKYTPKVLEARMALNKTRKQADEFIRKLEAQTEIQLVEDAA